MAAASSGEFTCSTSGRKIKLVELIHRAEKLKDAHRLASSIRDSAKPTCTRT